MEKKLNAILIEDNHDDALIIIGQIKNAGFDVTWKPVQTEDELNRTLKEQWDIVLCDYFIPNFSPEECLIKVKDLYPDVPFVVVCGKVSEETAGKMMEMGACDYLFKDNLARLPHIINREKKNQKKYFEKTRFDAEKTMRGNFTSLISRLPLTAYKCRWNGKWNYEYLSDDCYTLTGYKREEFENNSVSFQDIILPEDSPYVSAEKERALNNRTPYRLEYRILTRENILRWVEELGSGFPDDSGNSPGIEGVIIDVTEKKNCLEEIIKAKTISEETKHLKSAFMSNMSHELRTPLMGLLGFSEYLSGHLEGEDREFARLIHESGSRLLVTLSKLIDFSNYDNFNNSSTLTWIHLGRLIDGKIALFKDSAGSKGLEIIRDYKDGNVFVYTDEALLRQILFNILENAIKFTVHGQIKVSFDKADDCILIKISDTGIGIPAEKAKHIFDPFRQVSEGTSRVYQGVGLGLTIADRNVRQMGGSISFTSKTNEGTEFVIKLPCGIEQAVTATGVEETVIIKRDRTAARESNTLREILLVEDDVVNRSVIQLMLKDKYSVYMAISGKDALDAVMERPYDAILMDINLGESKNGASIAAEIRNFESYKTTPIIAITAYTMAGEKETFLKSGCSHYLAKPFNSSQLLDLLDEVLENK